MNYLIAVSDEATTQPRRSRRTTQKTRSVGRVTRAVAIAATAVTLLVGLPAASSGHEHRVAPGEMLSSIAAQYGTTVSAIADANGISNANLVVSGTVLTIPHHDSSSSTSSARTHTVAYGESLGSIASRYGVSIDSIVSANGISNPNLVVTGTVLQVPGSSGQATSASTTSTTSTHTVSSGEALASIAARYGTTASAIADANGISNPNLIVIGSSLQISGSSASSSSSQPVVGTSVAPLIQQWSDYYGVPADLMKALTWYESGWNNNVVSNVGAIGVGQLMPDTVDFLSEVLIGEPIDPYNVSDNIRGSVRFMRYLLDENGWNVELTLASYYQGLAATRKYGVYDSSWNYVNGIIALRNRF